MMEISDVICPILIRTTIATVAVGSLAWVLLRVLRIRSATVVRIICLAVLIQGCVISQVDVPLPGIVDSAVPDSGANGSTTPSRIEMAGIESSILESMHGDAFPATALQIASASAGGGETSSQLPGSAVASGILVGWCLGAAVLVVWSLATYLLLWNRIRKLDPAEVQYVMEWRAVLERAGVRRRIRMLQSAGCGPLLCRMPEETVLVIPADRWHALSKAQRETVLLHEAAHLRRRDLFKSLLARLLALPQWFNPLAWWALRRFDDAAEWACDDFAQSASDRPGTDYARALVELSCPRSKHHLVLAAAAQRNLAARIRRFLSPHPIKEESRMKSLVISTAIVAVAGMGALRPQAAGESPTATAAASSDSVPDDTDLAEAAGDGAAAVPASSTTLSIEESTTRPRREAVVDMGYLFKNDPVFLERQQQLKGEAEDAQHEMKDVITEIRRITTQIQSLNRADERDARNALEDAVNELRATMEGRNRTLRQRLVRAESEMYYISYRRITATIAEYAREHGIRIVRRSNTVAELDRDGMLTSGTAESQPYNPAADLANPQTILQLINRDIVYMEDEPVDITEAVLERLISSHQASRGRGHN